MFGQKTRTSTFGSTIYTFNSGWGPDSSPELYWEMGNTQVSEKKVQETACHLI